MKPTRILFTVLGFVFLFFLFACPPKKKVTPLTNQQELAKRLAGTWANPTQITAPQGVDTMLLKNLAMTFSADNNYNPTGFSSSGATDFFQSVSTSTWAFSGSSTSNLTLSQVSPVKNLTIIDFPINDNIITLSYTFVNQRTQSLAGGYEVTLSR